MTSMRTTRADRLAQAVSVMASILQAVPAGRRASVSVKYEQHVRGFDRYVVRVHNKGTPGRDGGSSETPVSPTT